MTLDRKSVLFICLLIQSHIAVMIATLLLTIVGIIVIVIHAAGLWLTSTVSLKYNGVRNLSQSVNSSLLYVGTWNSISWNVFKQSSIHVHHCIQSVRYPNIIIISCLVLFSLVDSKPTSSNLGNYSLCCSGSQRESACYCLHTTQVVTKCSSACWKCLLNMHDCIIIIGTKCCSLVEHTSCACIIIVCNYQKACMTLHDSIL